MPFLFVPQEIDGVVIIEPTRFEDHRGSFMETYRRSQFVEGGLSVDFVQDNFATSTRGVMRGLHYQKPPAAQAKLVRVSRGAIFDVGVDLRRGSPTFGRWIGAELSAENKRMLYLPPGFAHGYCVLSPEADVAYKVSCEYAPDLERGVVWNDPEIGIRWPIDDLVLSDKDQRLPSLAEADNPFVMDGAELSGTT